MNRKEIEKYLDRSGKNSVWWGKKNPAASKRMKENNPAQNKEVRIRMSKSLSDFFRSNLLPQEIAFSEILKQNKIDFIPQYPIGQYIVDFFVPDNMLCIEIDSTDKWGKKRRLAAVEKDLWLKRRGYSVLRINKKLLSEKRLILDILLANNVIRN